MYLFCSKKQPPKKNKGSDSEKHKLNNEYVLGRLHCQQC